MPKAYWVTTYREITDSGALARYAELAGPAIASGGGRFLVRGTPSQVYESGMMQRTVVVEFDNLEQALSTHDGPAYHRALEALGNGAVRDMRIIEGVA